MINNTQTTSNGSQTTSNGLPINAINTLKRLIKKARDEQRELKVSKINRLTHKIQSLLKRPNNAITSNAMKNSNKGNYTKILKQINNNRKNDTIPVYKYYSLERRIRKLKLEKKKLEKAGGREAQAEEEAAEKKELEEAAAEAAEAAEAYLEGGSYKIKRKTKTKNKPKKRKSRKNI